MKKALLSLLFITAGFICVMFGILIGRHTSQHFYAPSNTVSIEGTDETTAAEHPGLLNINSATLIQLTDLPGIGPTLAQRIIDYRTVNGDFTSIEELLLIEGIGEGKLKGIQDYISTGG